MTGASGPHFLAWTREPFDRILVAQAAVEKNILLTKDSAIRKHYDRSPVPRTRKKYRAQFLVDSGATDSMASGKALKKAGVKPVGRMAYELADGKRRNTNSALRRSSSWAR